MIRALWTAATGMAAQQLRVDVISNNLSNVNTTAFKGSRPEFQDLFYQTIREAGFQQAAGLENPSGLEVGMGTRPVATQKLFSQGDLQQTSNQFDWAIEGTGFFQVTLPDGTLAYTRAGNFKIDSTGRLGTADGYPLEPEITIPIDTKEINVGVDGTVSVKIAGQTDPTIVGNIELARFINPAGLKSLGRSLYEETVASGTPTTGTPTTTGFGNLVQGVLENSNIRVVDEMVSLITAQRAYELNSKAIQTTDEMIQTANNIRR